MYYPKISVITVVYNRVSTLERTIQSVLGQNYANVEYIVIDGASTDGTVAVIKKYADRISRWVSEKDQGIYDAMNKGLACATGDVVAFLNSDDWYLDDCLTYVAEQFKNRNADVCFFGVTRMSSDGKRIDRYPKVRIGEEGYERMSVFHPSTFVKRKVFGQVGSFDTQYRIAADYDWLLRMKNQGFAINCIDYVTTYYSDGGICNINWFEAQDEAEQIELKYAQDEAQQKYIRHVYAENWGKKKYLELVLREEVSNFALKELFFFQNKKVYIFGAGNIGEECCQLFHRNGLKIEGFLDNNQERYGTQLQGYLIHSPQVLNKANDYVIIAVFHYTDEIEEQLLQLGIQTDKIVRYLALKKKITDRLCKERLDQKHES